MLSSVGSRFGMVRIRPIRLPQKPPPGHDVIQPHAAQGTGISSLGYYPIERNATAAAHNCIGSFLAEFFGEISINSDRDT